jgi:hypothetical protein
VQPEISSVTVADNATVKAAELSQSRPPTPPPAIVPPVETRPATELARPEIPASPEEPPKRIVRREGVVRGTVSIQAPTYYELVDASNERVVNYLHLNQAILDKLEVSLKGFKDYVGRVIVVTGEESIDPRWPNTPVIEVETLKLVL